jgi:hypothetical protein
MAVLLRPTNALVLIPVVFLNKLSIKCLIRLALAGIPGGAIFTCLNFIEYGNPLSTGYGDVSNLFSYKNLTPSLINYYNSLPIVASFIIIIFPGIIFTRSISARIRLILVVWVMTFFGFYAFYYHTHETWWYLRFIMPALPALIIGSLLVLQHAAHLIANVYIRRSMVFFILAGCVCQLAIQNKRLYSLSAGKGEYVYKQACEWANSNIPSNAVILTMQCSGALKYYSEFTLVRWDMLDSATIASIEVVSKKNKTPIYAILFPFEQADVLHHTFSGDWKLIHSEKQISFWALTP